MPKRVILDTNVWISGIVWGEIPGKILSKLEKSAWEVYISPPILEEVDRVLDYPKIARVLKKAGKSKIEALERILSMSILVRPHEKINLITENSQDNKFLECAKEVKVDYIISGDPHLQRLKTFENTRILSPIKFLRECL